LGVSKVIRAMSADELYWLVEAQLSKWSEQETRKRQQKQKEVAREAVKQHAENLKWKAEQDTKAAQKNLETFRNVLLGSLQDNLALDWEKFLDRRSIRPFQFDHLTPDRDEIRLKLLGPEPREKFVPSPVLEEISFLEYFFPFLKRRRLERENNALAEFERQKKREKAGFAKRLKEYRSREKEVVEVYNAAVRAYNHKLTEEKGRYVQERDEFIARQEAHNRAVLAFRSRYEAGSTEAVERYVQMVLEQSSYPQPIVGEPDVGFDEASKILIVNFWLPGPKDIPNIVEYKYVASRKAIKPLEMKQKEFQGF
jgi:restriction system protein